MIGVCLSLRTSGGKMLTHEKKREKWVYSFPTVIGNMYYFFVVYSCVQPVIPHGVVVLKGT